MRKSKWVTWTIAILSLTFWLWACSSGSDGDGNGGGGGTTPTNNIQESDVTDIMSMVADNVPGCSTPSSTAASTKGLRALTQLGERITYEVQDRLVTRSTRGVPEELITEPIEDDCFGSNGTLDGSLIVDEDAGTISGNLVFDDFCIDMDGSQATVDGGASFNGTIDEGANSIGVTLNASTTGSGISIDYGSDYATIRINGLSVDLDSNDSQASLNLTLSSASVSGMVDGESQNITVSNLALSASSNDTSASLTVSGTFGNDDGTLSVSTPSTLVVDSEGNVIAGSIQISGGGNTSVLITPAGGGSNNFNVQADTNGDGDFDDTLDYSGTIDCSEVDLQL